MGGLSYKMPITATTMWIGGLGLAGVPPLAGFFSKDEILAAAMGGGRPLLFLLLLAGALMTAFYTFRLLFLAFSGAPRMGKEVLQHAHESPWVMTAPLALLAVLTLVAGFVLGLPLDGTRLARWLASAFALHEVEHSTLVPLLSVVVVVAGFVFALYRYKLTPVKPERVGQPSTALRALLLNAYYVDALYDRGIVRPLAALSSRLARAFDLGVLDGVVNGLGRAVAAGAGGLRKVQTGYVVNYALTMLAGAVVLVVFLLVR
jgi:NADH-quinone oxidoreductase subunit L